MLHPKNDGILKRPHVLLPAIRKILVRRSPADNRVPVLLPYKILHLLGSLSSRVQAPDETSHTGPGNVVDRDVVLFKPAQDADVSESKRASTLQGDADARSRGPRNLSIGRRGWIRRRRIFLGKTGSSKSQ